MNNEYPENNPIGNEKNTNTISDKNITGVSRSIENTDDNTKRNMETSQTTTTKVIEKGSEVNLSEMSHNLSSVLVGIGWDAPETTGEGYEFDIDASAFFLGADGRVRCDEDFIFYNNLETENGAIKHHGDNPDGKGEGDDEQITVELENVPFDVITIVFTVTIHEAEEREQHFGLMKNAYVRLVDLGENKELVRYNLTEDASGKDALIFAEIIRDGTEWKFRVIAEPRTGGLYEIAHGYGVYVAPT